MEGMEVTPKSEPQLAELVDGYVAAAEGIGTTLDPDGDWAANTLVIGDAESVIVQHKLDGPEDEKVVYGQALPMIIRAAQATATVTVFPAWLRWVDLDAAAREVPLEGPVRSEVVVVVGLTADQMIYRTARVFRGDAPPMLGPWTDLTDAEAVLAGGWVEYLRAALREVAAEGSA